MDIKIAREVAARIWCDREFSKYEMNQALAECIAIMLLTEADMQDAQKISEREL